MAELRLVNIEKRFGNVVAVENVSLRVAHREFITLVGPSGCGKTTTLNITAGLERLTSGQVWIDDREVTNVPPGARDIALVFQNYALYPHLTVRKNLAFPLRIRRQSKDEIARRIGHVSEMLNIGELLDRKPKELSGGQRQRVAVGRAIIRDPKICLLDEPLSNLDAALRVHMRAELKLLFSQVETTVILVTHDQAEAMTMSDRIVVMKDGRIQQEGAPVEVYNHPANVFVATFIGSPQMNMLPGCIVQDGDKTLVETIGLRFPLPEAAKPGVQGLKTPNVLVGVRPEDISMAGFGNSVSFQANIRLVEHMGAGAIVYYVFGDTTLISVEGKEVMLTAGTSQNVHINLSRLHLFDATTTAALF